MSAKWLVVGAGFTGAILAERLASECGAEVLVIDSRAHVGGNAHDTRNEDGVLVHAYGPHIFHTNAPRIVEYLSRFTEWRPYEHRVAGLLSGRLVPIPFNLTTLEILFPAAEAKRLTALLVSTYGMEARVPILTMRTAESAALRELADFIYENVFAGYTRKQWGLAPEELSPSVTARVPVSVSYDDRYFQDRFQKMPRDGYTRMFERILDHPRIGVSLNTAYADVKTERFDRIVYTGAIDAFFDFALGPLPYRSMRFDFRTYHQARHQPVASVNYPTTQDFTRITEMGHLTGEWGAVTTVAVEYPGAHRPGVTEPHYPIPRDEHIALHRRYLALAEKETPHIVFAGRLGDYRYYNMDQAAGRALSLFEKLAGASAMAR
jgi:UDP-galactopyranose mutase